MPVGATSKLRRYGLYVGGKEVPARSGAVLRSITPARGEPWAELADAGADDVSAAVAAAKAAFDGDAWRSLAPTRRGRLMMRLGDLVGEHAEQIALAETTENGKLYKEMLTQARIVPDWLYYFGGLADKIEGSVIPVPRQSVLNYTLREPLGVVGVITPWNSPVLLTVFALAPALAAGNTVVIKPSEVASAGVLEFVRLTEAAGFPPGVVNVVTGGPEAGAALVDHPDVAKITFVGGTAAGRRIAEAAGARLARVTLELGGKSPNIVFADADLDAATGGVLAGIFAAGGQTCVAGSRVLVQDAVHDELIEGLAARARSLRLGDPMDEATEMGPIATEEHLRRIDSYVAGATAEGAEAIAGGRRAVVEAFPNGFFYEPTILTGVSNDARVAREEVFGPVAAILRFRDEEDAVAIANDSEFGLAAGVWTRDFKRAHRVARRLQAGTVWINTYRALTFNSPFGGYKQSGFGRVNGIEAVNEYLQTKSVWCELSDEVQDPFTLKA
ncbi:MAG: aldehyde dehydrogenase [Actinobacteria bacterium]|nr:aldehyde dehydrogenase [Actinomycetota bacterium]